MTFLRYLPLTFLILGYALLAVIGTRTEMVFQWPSYLLFGLAAVATVLFSHRQAKVAPGLWCLVSMWLLTIYVVVRAGFSPVPYFGRMDIAMVLAAAIVYIVFSISYTRTRYRSIFIWLLLLLAFANVFVGIYQVLRDSGFSILPGYTRPAQVGAGGFYRNHNHLGGFLLFGAAFSLALSMFAKTGPKTRVILLFLVPVCLGGVAITASRGAMLSVGFSVMVLLLLGLFLAKKLYEYEFKKILIVGSTILGCVLIGMSVIGIKFLSKRSGIGSETGDSLVQISQGADGRFLMWSLAVDQWGENPVFGHGSRMYDIYSMEHWPASMAKTHGDAEFAHNDYVQMLGEYGVVGILLMLFFIAVHVGSGFHYIIHFRNKEFRAKGERLSNSLAQCLGALLVLAAYSIHSIVDFNLHLPANLIPVAFAFAILANPSARSRRAQPSGGTRALVTGSKIALPLAGVALVLGGVFYGRGEWHLEKARRLPLGNYGEVIAHTDESLKYDTGNFFTYRLRGTALLLFGLDFDIDILRRDFMTRSISAFEKGLEVNPYDIFCLTGLGRCYDELGEHDQAESYFILATKQGVRSREAHLRFGFHHVNLALEMVEDDLVGAMERIEMGELELQKAWQSNEEISWEDREYKELLRARRYRSMMWETHGNRLAATATLLGERGDRDEQKVYLESALDYYSRARPGAPDRIDTLNKKRWAIFDRIKKIEDAKSD